MHNRFDDALQIQQGACNPVAITNRLQHHVQALFRSGSGTDTIRNDPALRLIVHQLAFLFGTDRFDGIGSTEYDDAIKACEKGART